MPASYSVLTPYVLPPETPKRVNVGDGFILDSAEKLIGHKANHYFSTRSPLGDSDIEIINDTRALIIVGANSLRDDFSPAPAFTAETLAAIKVPIIMMGLGHYGQPDATRGLMRTTVSLLEAMLERFPYMSVRCDQSQRYISKSAPHLSESIMMTSCPVIHPVDNVNYGFPYKDLWNQLVVTITDRSHIEQQLPILIHAPKCFPAKRKLLALHQNYENYDLHNYARSLGYEIFASTKYEDYISLYKESDIHIGNRLHGHLKSLSLGIRSYLLPFDLRQVYFSESLDFPLISQLPSAEFIEYDFGRLMKRRDEIAPVMHKFVDKILGVIL